MDQPNQHGIAVAGAANIDQPGQDKLNAICWEEVFDFLSLKEIHNMSQTCKRLQRIARFYIKEYLPAVHGKFKARDCTIRSKMSKAVYARSHSGPIGRGLNKYITELHIDCKSLTILYRARKLEPNYLFHLLSPESFPLLEKLKLSNVKMSDHSIREYEGILCNIEALEIQSCCWEPQTVNLFVKHCTKLKSLRVHGNVNYFKNTESVADWLHNEYPILEHFDFDSKYTEVTGLEVITFLTKHTNIKQSGIHAKFFWTNMQAFKEADIQLDCLVIDFDFHDRDYIYEWITIVPFVHFLKELHERRFYKYLHLKLNWDEYDWQELVTSVAPLSTLNALNINWSVGIDLSSLVHLKELRCWSFDDTMDVENLAKNLMNLEQLSIHYARQEHVLPFVRYSKKLSKLHIDMLSPNWNVDRHFTKVLNLRKLNNERQQLKDEMRGWGPKIVCVFLAERDYLNSKWQLKDFGPYLVKLKRNKVELKKHFLP